MSDITPDDIARWFDGTQQAWDWLLEQGFAPVADFPAVEVPFADVGPYEMRDLDGRPSLFGIRPFSREMYEAWARNEPPRMMGLLETLDVYERMERSRRHADCPLSGCEDFEGQRLVPVATPGATLTMAEANEALREAFEGAEFLAQPFDDVPPRWSMPIRVVSREELRREYETPRTLRFSNGSTLTLPSAASVQPGDTVTINGVTVRAADLILDPAPAYAAMELPRVGLLTGVQAAALSAKQHLERARPSRRLDGRRAR